MGDAYPELIEQRALIERTLKKEEEQFLNTLDRGLALLENELVKLGDSKNFPGDIAFKLYDTYGFPADLTQDVVRDRGYVVDMEGFDKCMAEQKARAKSASTFGIDYNKELKITENTVFTGYDSLSSEGKITHIFKDGVEVDSIATDENAVIVLDKTPFYGEMGGQVGDKGVITIGENARFIVEDTKHVAKATIHVGRVDIGEFDKNATVKATVDSKVRAEIAKHHSATHLLDAALRQVIGDSVAQKGSYVDDTKLRFDYSHSQPLTATEKQQVADLVNSKIQENLKVETAVMDIDEAKKSGAIALFDEKYEDKVRVVSMGDFSKELCGGTHTVATGDLGVFVLLSDESIASGIRRIEALVGQAAVDYLDCLYAEVAKAKALLKVGGSASIATKTEQVIDHAKGLEKENEQLKEKIVALECAALVSSAHEVKGVKVIATKIDNYSAKELRVAVDDLKVRIPSSIIVLGSVTEDNKVNLIAAVSKDLTAKVKAGDLIREVASYVGGKGGGRPDMAQAGGTQPEGLNKALSAVDSLVSERI